MRRGALKLKDSFQLGASNTQTISVAAYSTGNKAPEDDTDKRSSENKDKPLSSTPISQLFSKLNLNVKTDTRPASRPRVQPRQQQPGARVDQAPREDQGWARPQRPQQSREPRAPMEAAPEDEFASPGAFQQRQRPRQRGASSQRGPLSQQGRPRRPPQQQPRGGPASGAPRGELAPRRRPGAARRPSQSGRGGREAQLLRNAPKVIQDLAAEEQVFQLREAEPMALINKQTNAQIRSTAEMPVPQKHLNQDWARALVMDMDPTVNINWGAPVKLPRYTLQTFFDTQSAHLKETLGIESEEEWQETKQLHFKRVQESVTAQNEMLGIRDEKEDEAVLFDMRDSVPAHHPMKNHVHMVVHQLTRNPGWSFQQKHQYMTKLLHEYVHKRH